MNKAVFWCGVALFIIGISLLLVTGSLPDDIFTFGLWFWVSLGGWLMIMISFAFGPED